DLAAAAREHADLVQPYLGRGDGVATHAAFWALSLAGWTGGTFLYVPRGLEVDGTLIARITQPRADATFLPHTLVVADEASSVTLMEELVSPDGSPGWFGGTVDIHALPGARVRYANLQRLGDQVWNIGAQRVDVGADATVTTLNTEVGGHGATAGAIAPIQRFYAESRGLDAGEAERMIVRGFFEQVIAKIPVEPVRTAMLAALAERIGHAEAFDETEVAV